MQLFLQFGHGMMTHSKELLKKWGSGTIILSPRDLSPDQLLLFSKEIGKAGGNVVIDPQFYDPRADHHRLTQHSFWPQSYDTTDFLNNGIDDFLNTIKTLNENAASAFSIIPGLFFEFGKDEWFTAQDVLVKKADSCFGAGEKLATIALSSEVVRNEAILEQIISASENWPVDGFYVVPEHPVSQYLVEDPIWLSNLIIFLAGLKLLNKKIILGYANHQMLIASLANIDAIASGIWINVRSFSTKRFKQIDDDTTSRRARWYYCPHTYSEYKIPFLDVAYRSGALDFIKPLNGFLNEYSAVLFSGALPSSVQYSETMSFRHYLNSLWKQAASFKRSTFNETVNAYMLTLNSASSLISTVHSYGVRGQDRDFNPIIDVNKSAISQLITSRGFALSMSWK